VSGILHGLSCFAVGDLVEVAGRLHGVDGRLRTGEESDGIIEDGVDVDAIAAAVDREQIGHGTFRSGWVNRQGEQDIPDIMPDHLGNGLRGGPEGLSYSVRLCNGTCRLMCSSCLAVILEVGENSRPNRPPDT
jgi:hypothetical protein